MSIFRPSARVTSPDGREWEIYAYKLKVRDRDDPEGLDDLRTGRDWNFDGLVALADIVLFVVQLVPRLLARLFGAATAGIRAARSDEWTIDAVTYLPHETVYSWTTTREHKGQVLAQVEGHLARGDVPQHLTHATFRGEQRR
jgi:hypothetical protein